MEEEERRKLIGFTPSFCPCRRGQDLGHIVDSFFEALPQVPFEAIPEAIPAP